MRFEEEAVKQMSFLQRLQRVRENMNRKRWVYRFLKAHEIKWLTSGTTLRLQTALSLKDRSEHFAREFPVSHMNPTLLREVYRRHHIRKKKYRWYKVDPNAN